MGGDIAAGIVAFVVVVGLPIWYIRGLIKVFRPLRIDPKTPTSFEPPFDKHKIQFVTGVVSHAQKRSESIVSGSVMSSRNLDGSVGSISGNVSTNVVVHDTFFLNLHDGSSKSVQLKNKDVHVGDGQTVTLLSLDNSSGYFMLWSHTTAAGTWLDFDSCLRIGLPSGFWCFWFVALPAFTLVGLPMTFFYFWARRRKSNVFNNSFGPLSDFLALAATKDQLSRSNSDGNAKVGASGVPPLNPESNMVAIDRVDAFCDQCGAPIATGARFCAGCGRPIGILPK